MIPAAPPWSQVIRPKRLWPTPFRSTMVRPGGPAQTTLVVAGSAPRRVTFSRRRRERVAAILHVPGLIYSTGLLPGVPILSRADGSIVVSSTPPHWTCVLHASGQVNFAEGLDAWPGDDA